MRPVYDMLTAVSARRSGHMPGHKGCSPFGAADLYALDTTELPNTDDLYAAEGGLRESMRLYARDGETVLLPRNAHLSAVNACVLGGMRVKWMPVHCTPDGYCYLAEEDVLAALRANPDARAMLLVRPDYYGGAMREDVFRRIAAAAHRQGTKVVVDEAHGAHFPWCDGVTSAGALGADADFAQFARQQHRQFIPDALRKAGGEKIACFIPIHGIPPIQTASALISGTAPNLPAR